MRQIALYFISTSIILLQACTNSKPVLIKDNARDTELIINSKPITEAMKPAIVYKTTKDYSDYVPVTMNKLKTKIISYPDPLDIYYNGSLAKPTKLKNNYLLDNRGINENTVFLNYTYEAYARLEHVPSMQDMLHNILDKYPFEEIIYCGERSEYSNEVEELNKLIDANFKGCKRYSYSISLDETK